MDYRCGKCGETKPEAEFFPSQRKTGAWCKACHHERYGKKEPHPSRPCEQCGTVMEDPNPKARFCSRTCKNREKTARAHRAFLEASAKRICQNCGASLAGKNTAAKWCSERCAQRRPTRKAVARRARLKHKYGIDVAEYDRLVKAQRGKCAICKGSDPFQVEDIWAIDHDHVTGQVRGLLCSKCNTGIGQLRDDPEILTAAARYIRRHRQLVLPSSS